MTHELVIDQIVASDIPDVKRIISASRAAQPDVRTATPTPRMIQGAQTAPTLYDAVLSTLSDGTRNSPAQIELLNIYETAVAVFRATSLELRTAMDVTTLDQRLQTAVQAARDWSALHSGEKVTPPVELNQEIVDAKFFSNRYALAFAGNVGLALMDAKRAKTDVLFGFGTEHDASADRNDLTARLSRQTTTHFVDDVKRLRAAGQKVDDDALRYTFEAVFTTWINQFSHDTFKNVVKERGVDDTKLVFGNYSMQNGVFRQKYDQVVVEDRFMRTKRSDIIGNAEFVDTVWQELLKLALYSPEQRDNPANPAFCIFTYGPPGCGKTYTAHALIREFADICKQNSLPLWALTHSTTDYASKYQNETANQLMLLANKVRDFPGLVIMYISDADNIFPSRSDPDMRVEQRQTLDVYMRLFDGSLVPKNGRVITLMDANYVDGIDEATRNRVFDKILELHRFQTAEEFAQYSRMLLSKGNKDPLVIDDADWLKLGEYLLNSRLSNREITHVARDLRGGFKADASMIGKPYEEIVAKRSEYMRGLTGPVVLDRFKSYVERVESIEADSIQKKLDTQYSLFKGALSSRAPNTDRSSEGPSS